MNSTKLICKELFFNSELDEAAFFEWVEKISSIQDCKGIVDELHLEVKCDINDDELRELIALFSRYEVDMSQLKQLATDNNKKWFQNEQAYWYTDIFG